jgi:flagellar motility protein MotE (MotC chaperone)
LALLAVFKLAVIGLLWIAPHAPQGPILGPVIVRPALAASPGSDTQVPDHVATETKNATTPPAQIPQPLDQNAREQALDKREADLKALEMELDEKLVRLRELEVRMQGLIDAAAAIRDEKMAHLIDVYSNMKPKQAAQVLGTLEDATAVKILAGMTGRKAGEILSSVRADRAAKLSEALTRMQTSETGN